LPITAFLVIIIKRPGEVPFTSGLIYVMLLQKYLKQYYFTTTPFGKNFFLYRGGSIYYNDPDSPMDKRR
jgi:hypothetical protein